MARLQDKVAVITGAAGGMGYSHAELFIEEGAYVVITDINEEAGRAAAEKLGDRAHFVKQDVASEEDWQRLVDETVNKFGDIDILVNNAGISPTKSFEELSVEEYRKIVDINQMSVFIGMKAVLDSMRETGAGSIINISSINGIVAGAVAYTDTKFAVRGMTKAVAKELAGYNIRVNSVHPGIIDTPMVQESDAYEQIQQYAQAVPLKRMAQPEEVSQVVLFLASDEASYCNGQEFVVDGGLIA